MKTEVAGFTVRYAVVLDISSIHSNDNHNDISIHGNRKITAERILNNRHWITLVWVTYLHTI